MIRTVLVVGVLALVALVGGYVAVLLYASKAVALEIKEVSDSGYPTTVESLEAWYQAPTEGANAADLYTKAFSLDESSEKTLSGDSLLFVGEASLPEFNAPLRETDRAAAAAYLTAKAETLKALHEASSTSACRFPVQIGEADAAEQSHLTSLRHAVHLLALEAIAAAENRQDDAAVSALVAGYAAASSTREEPLIASQLARAANVFAMTQALERLLNRVPLDNAQLSQMLNAVTLSEAPHAFERAFAGERFLGLTGFHDVPVGMTEDGTATLFGRFYSALGIRRLDKWAYAVFMRNLISAAELPLHQRRAAYQAWSARVEKLPKWIAISKRELDEFSKAANADLRATSLLRVARTAVAIQQFRNDSQRMPDSLDALVPRYLEVVPGDPFASAPLRYEGSGIRAEVSSVGLDGVPDSGLSTDDDIIVSVVH